MSDLRVGSEQENGQASGGRSGYGCLFLWVVGALSFELQGPEGFGWEEGQPGVTGCLLHCLNFSPVVLSLQGFWCVSERLPHPGPPQCG